MDQQRRGEEDTKRPGHTRNLNWFPYFTGECGAQFSSLLAAYY